MTQTGRFFGAKVSSIAMSLGLELEKDQVTMNMK